MKTAAGIVLALNVAVVAPAFGQSYEEAEKKSNLGRAEYDKGRYETALGYFKEAFSLYPSEKYLFNCAKACLRLDDPEGAIYYYEQYLSFNPVASDRVQVENEVKQLRERLKKKGLVEVRLVSNPPKASVRLVPERRSEVTSTPGSVFLSPGEWKALFSLEGYPSKEMLVEARDAGKGQIVVEAVLRKGVEEVKLDPVEVKPDPVEVKVTPPNGLEKPGDAAFPMRAVLVAAGGAGVAVAGVGGWFWYDGWSAMSDAREKRDANEIDQDEHNKRYGAGRDDYVLGQWIVGSGVLIAAAAAFTWAMLPGDQQAPLPVTPGVAPTPGGAVFCLDAAW